MSKFLDYQTRPSKHVERKIFIETLQYLRGIGYKIPSYHYVGFGNFYFIDFILFHKFLSIKKMTSLENNKKIKRRVKFNKPYSFIDIKLEDFSNYVSSIRPDKEYFIWLDYECQLDEEILRSIGSLIHTLKNGSILIITVNAELWLVKNATVDGQDLGREIKNQQINELQKGLQQKLSPFCGTIEKEMITPAGLPKLFASTLQAQIKDSLQGRSDDKFFQLFNYIYKDGSQMLTFGGIIDHKSKKNDIKLAVKDLKFINQKGEPEKIAIPPLTAREKLHLDQKITTNNKILGKIRFELDKAELESYIKFAKHYPSFHEVFMG